MAEGRRPGGLTALAVINFVFFGSSILSLVGLAVFFTFIGMAPTDKMDAAQKTQIEAMQNMGAPTLVLIFALTTISGVLLLLSGIGYLKQKKVMGRMLGNVYGVLSIIGGVVSGLMFKVELGGGFNIGTIIGLVYPILTLILINTTFKDDLTN